MPASTTSTSSLTTTTQPPTFDPTLEPIIQGPFSIFSNSFTFEFRKPAPWRNATVLIKASYANNHPLWKNHYKGHAHPQMPPLHLHFDQAETIQVLSGRVRYTTGYDLKERVLCAADGPDVVHPMVPHIIGPPVIEGKEDTVMLIWAHPKSVQEPMDHLFFLNLFMLLDEVHEGKARFDPLQMMLTQHSSASAMVMFPKAWWLGSLRWRVPYVAQMVMVWVARWQGKTALCERFNKME